MKKLKIKVYGCETFFYKSKCKFCQSPAESVVFYLNRGVSEKNFYAIKDYILQPFKIDSFYMDYSVKERTFKVSYLFDATSIAFGKAPAFNYSKFIDKNLVASGQCSCGETSWLFVNCAYDNSIKHKKAGWFLKTISVGGFGH